MRGSDSKTYFGMIRVAIANFLFVLTSAQGIPWYEGVIYQVYSPSFKDSDGDGFGDLNGIRQKLSHLADAGATAVWLSPFFKSPMVDFGYDVADYTAVDSLFGTIDDFLNLLNEAHEYGMAVVLDLVPNHTSDQHQWFLISSDPSHPLFYKYKDYYVWKPGKMFPNGTVQPPNNWVSAFGGSAWTFNRARGMYYLHQYDQKQPDLNYRNSDVVNEMNDVLRFWLNKGVDGFRMGGVSRLAEAAGFPDEEWEGQHTQHHSLSLSLVQVWRRVLDEHQGVRILITEVSGTVEQVIPYFGQRADPGAHLSLNFGLINNLTANSTAEDFINTIMRWMNATERRGLANNWVLGSHDHPRLASRFGCALSDGLMMLMMTLPGSAITYYGEEIGMLDNEDIDFEHGVDPQGCKAPKQHFRVSTRDPQRTPFQWDSSQSAGFSKNTTTWLPINKNYRNLNLALQLNSPNVSHYKVYKLLTTVRHLPVVRGGLFKIKALSSQILVLAREQKGQQSLVVVLNLSEEEKTANLRDAFPGLQHHMTVHISSVTATIPRGEEADITSFYLAGKASYLLLG